MTEDPLDYAAPGEETGPIFYRDPSLPLSAEVEVEGKREEAEEKGEEEVSEEQEDPELEDLILEYQQLRTNVGIDMDWALDEQAARTLRKKHINDPQSRVELEQIMSLQEVYGVRQRRDKKSRGRVTVPIHDDTRAFEEIDFKDLNRRMKEFVRKAAMGERLEIDPFPPAIRRMIHELGQFYRLEGKSEGEGVERHCVFFKTEYARLPSDHGKLDRYLESVQRAADRMTPKSKKETNGKRTVKTKPRPSAQSTRIKSGSIVGDDAPRIADENVGSLLLKKMGWSPGQGLGSAKDGRTDPISAVFKGNRSGLGLGLGSP